MNENITINLLDQELQINCSQDKTQDLKKAAIELEHIMQNIKQRSSTKNREKITILAALELAYTLNQEKEKQKNQSKLITNKIESLGIMFEKILTTKDNSML